MKPISFSQIANRFSGAQKGYGAKGQMTTIVGSQHCELTLALEMLQMFQHTKQAGPIKIGCSKASCYWCHVYLSALNDQFPDHRVVTFSTHGKLTKGWLLPEANTLARDRVVELIGDFVDEIFWRAWGIPRRKSDSPSVSGSFESSPSQNWILSEAPV